jgi:Xaa-Pro aminopeptidase
MAEADDRHNAAKYQGDAALARLLAEAGVEAAVDEIRALVRGVAAAPAGHDPSAWTALVAPSAGSALVAQLKALRAEFANIDNGIGASGSAAPRLAALRKELKRRRLDGFVVPLADAHQGEYLAARDRRLAWLTGFTGSAGVAVVLAKRAAIFVDGRYTLQAEAEVDGALYSRHHLIDEPPQTWLESNLRSGQQLGYDSWLHTVDGRAKLQAGCDTVGATLVACEENPVDAIWDNQPPAPIAPVVPHEERFAGVASTRKRRAVARELAAQRADAALLSAPDSIAWLLNVRGGDVACSPLPQSFVLLHADGRVDWFVDPRKATPALLSHLGNEAALRPLAELSAALDVEAQAKRAVLLDSAGAPAWLFDRLERGGAKLVKGFDPCAKPKACKNTAELNGARAAHRRDGAALVRFLHWLHEAAPAGGLSELKAAAHLAALRAGGEHYRGPSFETISGAGPNGAIVHYRVTPESNRKLETGSLYLVDSGGQYLDGTTDVTRTVAIGAPSAEHKERFTRVLKGHIALETARFPRGTTGNQLDTLARQFLWQVGLDYDHGTGHGVGSYLNVHEGPQRISKLPSKAALEPGMIVSNEPGYYEAGAYGIRIENLVTVIEIAGDETTERPLLGFETLTMAPIDRALVESGMLGDAELAWLNGYHATVCERLGPLLEGTPAARWLEAATAPLDR